MLALTNNDVAAFAMARTFVVVFAVLGWYALALWGIPWKDAFRILLQLHCKSAFYSLAVALAAFVATAIVLGVEPVIDVARSRDAIALVGGLFLLFPMIWTVLEVAKKR
jgi:hypothetical protein